MRQGTTESPLFAGVTLPPVPAIGGQPQVINTKTLMIYGTGRSGGGGGRGGRGGAAGAGGAGGAAQPPANQPQLYAIDKATGQQVATVRIPQVNTAVPMTFMHKGKQYIVFAYGQGSNTGLTALTLPVAAGSRNSGAGSR
jgi:quinoprotein glucose dehydrogenase